MIRLLAKARQALLTDPVTGEPISPAMVVAWTYIAFVMAMSVLFLSLGLGAGQ
ncbi:hypothetical protein [Sphingobium yanoikuyae]|uniref:hypothetical protein n=1 Tax=Sphingobium yanoikuyae TaxID=13690 RepID=UPI0026ECCD3E|nr:hypothetical protein [Sphingobium yanoikuyae]